MAVTAPTLTPLPPAPLPTDAEAVFDAKAGVRLTAEEVMVVELNASFGWIATQVNAAEGYAVTASQAATAAGDSAEAAGVSLAATQALAAALGDDAGLPSLAGNARRALAVLQDESGASFQSQIKALYIEPILKQSSGGSVSLNVGVSGLFDLTLTANTAVTFTGLPTLSASEMLILVLRVTQGATAYSLTLPGSIVWLIPGGQAPSPPNSGRSIEYIFTFEGSTIIGRQGSST